MSGKGQREGKAPSSHLGPWFHQITHLTRAADKEPNGQANVGSPFVPPMRDANEQEWPKGR